MTVLQPSRERTEGSMQVGIMLQIVGDDGTVGDAEEVASLTKITERAEDLGLSLAESKALLAAAQQRIVEAQVDCWLEKHQHCPISGRKPRCKGSYPITFRTLFGDVRLKSPRYYLPKERQNDGPATISPLTQLLPDHVAPERLYLETRWASLVPYLQQPSFWPMFCLLRAVSTQRRYVSTSCGLPSGWRAISPSSEFLSLRV